MSVYGGSVPEERALATARRAFAGPLNFVDTSNGYGVSEQRIGIVLRQIGGLPVGALLGTKVDPVDGGPFDGARGRASVKESMERLGLDHLALLHLHDPERISFAEAMAPDGPVVAMRELVTYDEAGPPLPGGWTVVERMARGAEIPVHGDGTSLWTLTHAEDFALGLVGLLGNPRAIGETFHITGDDVYTWDQIYTIVGKALGVEAKLVHVPSELFPVVAPDWFWSDLLVGDLAHSAVFDNSKIRRFVPGFAPKLTFHRSALRMVQWRESHLAQTKGDPATDAVLERVVAAYHAGRDAFAALAP